MQLVLTPEIQGKNPVRCIYLSGKIVRRWAQGRGYLFVTLMVARGVPIIMPLGRLMVVLYLCPTDMRVLTKWLTLVPGLDLAGLITSALRMGNESAGVRNLQLTSWRVTLL